jgi:putative oxidoreductase
MSPVSTTTTPRQLSLGLAILRVIVGVIFVAHGSQKLFVFGVDGLTAGFTQMGIPMAAVSAPLVMLAELLGGIALLTGLVTRYAAAVLAVVMLGAIAFAHLPAGFFNPNGIEFPLALFAATLTLAVTGPGALSLDARLGRRDNSNPDAARPGIHRAA